MNSSANNSLLLPQLSQKMGSWYKGNIFYYHQNLEKLASGIELAKKFVCETDVISDEEEESLSVNIQYNKAGLQHYYGIQIEQDVHRLARNLYALAIEYIKNHEHSKAAKILNVLQTCIIEDKIYKRGGGGNWQDVLENVVKSIQPINWVEYRKTLNNYRFDARIRQELLRNFLWMRDPDLQRLNNIRRTLRFKIDDLPVLQKTIKDFEGKSGLDVVPYETLKAIEEELRKLAEKIGPNDIWIWEAYE